MRVTLDAVCAAEFFIKDGLDLKDKKNSQNRLALKDYQNSFIGVATDYLERYLTF